MKNIPIALRFVIGAAIIAVVVLLVQAHRDAANAAGWDALTTADRASDTPEALQSALEAARDTPAEPWIAFQLAERLYAQGGRENMDRAKSVAQSALDRFADHPVAPSLKRVIESADSFLKLAPG
jgi:cytochrome c-type biogenesis protein CcmH/NrfG